MPTLTTTRFPFLAPLAVVLALGTCQLAATGMATDRGRHGQFGRSAGNRLGASRSDAPGCESAVRDGSLPGEVVAPVGDDHASPRSLPLHLLAAFLPSLPPPSAEPLVVLASSTTPPTRFAPAIPGRGPPRG